MNSRVLELFGCSTSEPLAANLWHDLVEAQRCPYLEKKCIKVRKSSPDIAIGTCTVAHGTERMAVMICPHRLLERRKIFVDCLHLLTLHQPGNELHIVPEVLVGDALKVNTKPEDVVYLDPPYTKRQYAAYYHILETLVAGDEPDVDGVTGLRPWRDRASDFCYKRKALSAMVELVRTMRAGRVLISYSDEGHIALGDLTSALRPLGEVTVHNLGHIRRYTPNDESRANGEQVREVVVELARELENVRPARSRRARDFAPGAALQVTA